MAWPGSSDSCWSDSTIRTAPSGGLAGSGGRATGFTQAGGGPNAGLSAAAAPVAAATAAAKTTIINLDMTPPRPS